MPERTFALAHRKVGDDIWAAAIINFTRFHMYPYYNFFVCFSKAG